MSRHDTYQLVDVVVKRRDVPVFDVVVKRRDVTHTNANDYTALDDYVNQLVRTVTSHTPTTIRRSMTTSTSWYVQ